MTGIEASRQVIDLVRANEDSARHGRGCSPDTIARAEREPGLTFPPSYRLLVEEFGTWDVAPTEFLGVHQTEAAGDVLLGSVTETLDARADVDMPPELMVILLDDVWSFAVLDTSQPDEDGEYPVFAWNPGVLDGGLMEKIADSLGEFALKECQQNLS
ncbi:SMI1/KNR4 family protein [Streptomyces fulvoviolaceus]|uniref:SMI1/KNR4 family protein n=1 Tax=Streptomyces fulvoviolaceus TaxID=285535 RepID=UPI0021C1DC9F|nr:SMI1/KNR4 family protein [Streptomyces fulvoviolaceus]MCT9083799.1 SMI1/KNR4 family protein [Streptomyces fulvoviolaceus]